MNFQKHCPGCFRRKDGLAVCPFCGYDESAPRSPLFLPHGTILAGQYRVGRVLGRPGGFGITYLGWDIYLQQKVAIKEYLPPDIAARIPESMDVTVHTSDDRRNFDFGREQFLREARIVARLDHPHVVRVRSFFNANDTAYMVMDYYEGMSVDTYFQQIKPVLEARVAVPLMAMILDGLSYVHEHGLVHRDIKPSNIYLAAVGRPILLDFGAARHAITQSEGRMRSFSVVLTEGYAPLEQYQRRGAQGPWTDVYGVGATLYRMITGQLPPIALDRIHRDALMDSGFSNAPPALRGVLARAMAIRPEDRFQTATDFRIALESAASALQEYEESPVVSPAAAAAALDPSLATRIVKQAEELRQNPPEPVTAVDAPPRGFARTPTVSPPMPLPIPGTPLLEANPPQQGEALRKGWLGRFLKN